MAPFSFLHNFNPFLVVNQFTTSREVLQQLSAHGYVPGDNEGFLVLTTSAGCILLPTESLCNVGLGTLSLLWLQICSVVLIYTVQLLKYFTDDSSSSHNESNTTDEVLEKQKPVPSGRVMDPANIGELQLSSHQHAHKAATSTGKDTEGSSSNTCKREADEVKSDVDDIEGVGTDGPSSSAKGKSMSSSSGRSLRNTIHALTEPACKRGKKLAGKAADAAELVETGTV